MATSDSYVTACSAAASSATRWLAFSVLAHGVGFTVITNGGHCELDEMRVYLFHLGFLTITAYLPHAKVAVSASRALPILCVLDLSLRCMGTKNIHRLIPGPTFSFPKICSLPTFATDIPCHLQCITNEFSNCRFKRNTKKMQVKYGVAQHAIGLKITSKAAAKTAAK